jgi:hypothetical protein
MKISEHRKEFIMNTITSKSVAMIALFVGVFTFATVSAHAAPKQKKKDWKQDHPRRAEVNKRLNNQNKRVDNGLAQGKLTPGQAEKIQGQDARIRQQERQDASQNGGHITKAEQRQLNKEENGVSREINRDEHGNAKPPVPAAAPAPAAPTGQ